MACALSDVRKGLHHLDLLRVPGGNDTSDESDQGSDDGPVQEELGRDGKLQVFKRGGFFLALNSQVPVVPVSIQGTFEIMPKKSFFIKRGKVNIAFHPVVPVQEFNRDTLPSLMDRVRDAVKSGLAD